jgi:hypothetical protein
VAAATAAVFLAGVASAFALSGSEGTGFDVRAAAPGVAASADGTVSVPQAGSTGAQKNARKSSPAPAAPAAPSAPAAAGVTVPPVPRAGSPLDLTGKLRTIIPPVPATLPAAKLTPVPKAVPTPSGGLSLPGLGVPELDGLLGVLPLDAVGTVTTLLDGLSPEVLALVNQLLGSLAPEDLLSLEQLLTTLPPGVVPDLTALLGGGLPPEGLAAVGGLLNILGPNGPLAGTVLGGMPAAGGPALSTLLTLPTGQVDAVRNTLSATDLTKLGSLLSASNGTASLTSLVGGSSGGLVGGLLGGLLGTGSPLSAPGLTTVTQLLGGMDPARLPVVGTLISSLTTAQARDTGQLLTALPDAGLPVLGQVLGLVQPDKLPLVGSLTGSASAANGLPLVGGLLTGLDPGTLPVVGTLLGSSTTESLSLVGSLLGLLPL